MNADQPPPAGLLHAVSRSLFWNAALLPVVTAAGLLLSILVRRSFGLESGIYDVVLGVANSILFYSSLGLAGSLPKFLPEIELRAGRRAAARLVRRLGALRMAVIAVILAVVNLWAEPLARVFNFDGDAATYVHLLSVLIVGRAAIDFAYRTLDSFLEQFSVNMLSLAHGVLDVCLAALAIAAGWGLAGVIGALATSAVVLAAVSIAAVLKRLRAVPDDPAGPVSAVQDVDRGRIWKLSAVTYVRDLSLYFATPAFASPALAAVLEGPEPVALFATGYFIAASTVTLVVSGFRGVYRPAFARVMAAGERAQLQRAFSLINKAQILAVVPAGFGLAVMVGDYLPLLYGDPFAAAIPIARVLVALLFAETAFAVGLLVLWVGEQYRPVLAAQLVMLAGAPLFVWAAGRWGLMGAAIVLGGSRLAASAIGYLEARRRYQVRYPWAFAARVALVSSVMAAALAALRQAWGTSIVEAAVLTALGALIVAAGIRVSGALGPGEIELLERTNVPGKALLVRWLQKPTRSSSR